MRSCYTRVAFCVVVLFQIVCGNRDTVPPPSGIALSTSVAENFDKLQSGPTGTTQEFTQGSTLAGWWSSENTYLISDGSANVGGLYSFGEVNSGDRALGAITSNKKKSVIFGITLQPTASISEVNISFIGKQWRYGGDIPDSSILTFDYSVMTSSQYNSGGWGASGDSKLWTPVPTLSVIGVTSGPNNTVGPVRYSQYLSANISTPGLDSESVLQCRWTAHNFHDGLAIEAFKVVVTGVVVPTPVPTVNPTAKPTHAPTGNDLRGKVNMWQILGIAGWSMAAVFVGLTLFVAYKWRKSRSDQYNLLPTANLEEGIGAPDGIGGLGVYGAYVSSNRNALVNGNVNGSGEGSRLLNSNIILMLYCCALCSLFSMTAAHSFVPSEEVDNLTHDQNAHYDPHHPDYCNGCGREK